MKKISLSNKAIAYIICNQNNTLSVCNTDKHMFDIMVERLNLFANAADTDGESVTRGFTFVYNPQTLIITFGKNITQAIIYLHSDRFIDASEKSTLLAAIKATQEQKWSSSLHKWLTNKFARSSSTDNESKSLLKKE